MENELKPCPFCRGTAIYKVRNPIDELIGTATVCCRECCSSAPLHNWNTRAESEQIKKLTEALEGVSKWLSTRDSDVTAEFDTAKLDELLAEIKGES